MQRIEAIVSYIMELMITDTGRIKVESVIKNLLERGYDMNEISAALVWLGTVHTDNTAEFNVSDKSFRYITLKEKQQFDDEALSALLDLYGKTLISPEHLEAVINAVENSGNEHAVNREELLELVDAVVFSSWESASGEIEDSDEIAVIVH